jgi:bacterioferritin (cytochrome b1)
VVSLGGPAGPVEPIRGEAAPGSRRRLLLTAAAGVVGLSGCGGSGRSASQTLDRHIRGGRHDAGLLNRLLGTEYYAIAAYTAATPRLSGDNAAGAKRFLGQEVLHADRLIGLIERLGGHPHRARASYDLGHPQTASELVGLLLATEELQLKAYRDAIPQLSSGSLKQMIVSIFATQAQHAVVWRLQLGRQPAPAAFVTGYEAV